MVRVTQKVARELYIAMEPHHQVIAVGKVAVIHGGRNVVIGALRVGVVCQKPCRATVLIEACTAFHP